MLDLRIGSLLLLQLAAAATATTTVTRTRTTTVTETTTVQAQRIFRFEPRPRMEEGGYKTCDLQKSECSIAKMPRDASTVVYPGGDTRCISEKTAYGFQVIPGDGDKLLVFFQGGGACWDAGSTKRSMCVEDAYPSYMTGLLDRSNAKNPYVNHTVVQLLYCSGDAFAADAADHGWTTANGDRAVQSGQQNAHATFAWLRGQVGALADLVVGGDSAGSLAAQAWGNAIFDAFPAARKTALLDSYLGVFPDGCQGNVLSEVWPMCTGPLATSLAALGLDRACAAGNLTIQKVLAATATRHADAPFAFIQSKADAVQKGFFESIALSFKSWCAFFFPFSARRSKPLAGPSSSPIASSTSARTRSSWASTRSRTSSTTPSTATRTRSRRTASSTRPTARAPRAAAAAARSSTGSRGSPSTASRRRSARARSRTSRSGPGRRTARGPSRTRRSRRRASRTGPLTFPAGFSAATCPHRA